MISSFRLPATMQGRIKALGKTAKCASGQGSVLIDQTVRLFFRPFPFVVFSLGRVISSRAPPVGFPVSSRYMSLVSTRGERSHNGETVCVAG